MSEMQTSTIGKEFTLPELIKFVAPPVVTRLLVSLLSTLDDALFVSRYCGQNALAAFSIAFPWFMMIEAIGFMISSVSVLCSIKMGEKKNEEAKSDFTTAILIAFTTGCCMTLFLAFFLEDVLLFLGETPSLLPYAKTYMTVSKFYIPLLMVNFIFNSFYVVAGKPKCSMISSGINTFCQFTLDYLFIVRCHMGIVGAAYANLIGNTCVLLFGLFFYSNPNREICLTKPHSQILTLMKQIFKYGKMTFITSLTISISGYIGNHVELRVGGEMFVAAYTIVNNVTFMLMNSYFGLVGSTSPIASYAYGEKNERKLSRIIKQTLILTTGLMLILISVIFFGKGFVIELYLGNAGSDLVRQMAYKGFTIYPLALIFFGYNVFVQEFMNAVGNTRTSLTLSILENMVFNNLCMLLLPLIFGTDGIWYTFAASEMITFIFTAVAAYQFRDVYGYGKSGIATFVEQ